MKLIVSCVILGLTLGCATWDKVMAQAEELSRPFPPPPKQLDAPHESRAILLLDIDLTQVLNSFHVVGVELAREDGGEFRAGEFDEFHLLALSETESGLVLFGSLPPARYWVVKVRAWVQNQQARVEVLVLPPATQLMTMELTAGKVHYLHLAGHQPMFSSSFEWQPVNDPSRAHEALGWVDQHYPGSSWSKEIQDELLAH